jgi:glycerophosphoryl diester phosphodiesterase
MPNVARFTLSTARDFYLRGAGQFIDGVLDVDANDLRLVSRTRYLSKPYGAVEVGIVDSETPAPSLPAVPGPAAPDPYPQYPTLDEIVASEELGAASVAAASEALGAPPKWADRDSPFVIAHRGGALVSPEHTMEAYRTASARGFPLEQDLVTLGDGTLGVMHDGTVDRMTTATGNVTAHTAISWKNLSVDAATIVGGGWPDGLRLLLHDEVLREFGNRDLLVQEAKDSPAMGTAIDMLEARGIARGSVLLASSSLTDCQLAVSRGWTVAYASTNVATAAANGIEWLNVSQGSVTAQLCADAHAAGIKVAVYTVNRHHERDPHITAGVDAIYSDDPLYIDGDRGARKTDLFATGTWMPGLQGNNGASSRGKFLADNSWGYDSSTIAEDRLFALHGWLKPTDPTNFVLDFEVAIDAVSGGNLTYWAAVYIGTTDIVYADLAHSAGRNGYNLLLRANGALGIYKVATPAASVLLGEVTSAAGTDVVLGTFVPMRITVTPTTLTLARRDLPAETVTVTDSTTRGRYFSLGRRFSAVRFRNVSVN